MAEGSRWDWGDAVYVQMNLQSLSRNVTWHLSEIPVGSSVHSVLSVVLIAAAILVGTFSLNARQESHHHQDWKQHKWNCFLPLHFVGFSDCLQLRIFLTAPCSRSEAVSVSRPSSLWTSDFAMFLTKVPQKQLTEKHLQASEKGHTKQKVGNQHNFD